MFGWQKDGLRPVVEDTTIYSSMELSRISRAARADNVAIDLAIATKVKAKKRYCDARMWDFWLGA
ncbi:hypothetical protein OAO87_04715, partial [bacterium]|nr:hypothetical protein [bacterium]